MAETAVDEALMVGREVMTGGGVVVGPAVVVGPGEVDGGGGRPQLRRGKKEKTRGEKKNENT